MDVRVVNGTVVTRIYGKNVEGELVAVFQYSNDAVEFVESKLAEDKARDWLDSSYIVSDSGTGKVTFHCHKDTEKQDAA